MSTFRQPLVSLRPSSTSLAFAGTESHRSPLFPTFEQAFMRLCSMLLSLAGTRRKMWACDTCQNTSACIVADEDVMPIVATDVEKKRVKRALGTDNAKDTKVGGREVRLSRHLGFFGWMWQPLCCLISSPPTTVTVEGLRTSVPFGIVDTTLQHTVELMFADSCECHAVVTVNHGWWEREVEGGPAGMKAYIGLHYLRSLWSAIYGLNIDRSGDFFPYKTSSHGC